MTLQLELWHLITLAITVLGGFASISKMAATQTLRRLDVNHEALQARLSAIEAAAREEAGQWQRVEREILQLKAELPVSYVRREDYIRGQSVIESKLDGLAAKIENTQLRGVFGITPGGNHAA